MSLTLDASVETKCFVEESGSTDGRLLLSPRITLRAPDHMLMEYANFIWKRVQRGDLTNPEAYFGLPPLLSAIVSLVPDRELVVRASQISAMMDHPIYDCLYIGCAESTGSGLITADIRFAKKCAVVSEGPMCILLGPSDARRQLEAAAYAPAITFPKIERLAEAFDLFDRTQRHVLERFPLAEIDSQSGTNQPREFVYVSPSYKRLLSEIRQLNAEQYIDLLALGWMGANESSDWTKCFERAEEMTVTRGVDPDYSARYGNIGSEDMGG